MPADTPLVGQPLPLMVAILLLLALARALGELAERWGQPAMLGEIVAGLILGPSLLLWLVPTAELKAVADLGVFMLIVLAGMELDPRDLQDSLRGRSAWMVLGAFFAPLALGLLVGAAFGLDAMRTLFLGLGISITALPVAVRTLLDLGLLRTEVGQRIIAVAVATDILALLLLGVILNIPGTRETPFLLVLTLLVQVAKASALILLVIFAYRGAQLAVQRLPRLNQAVDRAVGSLRGKESLFAATIVFVLVFAALGEALGLHFVIGAFFGAMLLSHEILGVENFLAVQRTTSSITMGFLAPVFFGIIGLEFDATSLSHAGLAAAVLLAAFAGKIGGGFLGARLAGMPSRSAVALAAGLNGRGIMDLVIANIALTKGFIDQTLFSILVLVIFVSMLATPLVIKWVVRRGADFGAVLPRRSGAIGES
jgi:Kef-type K+ transport system membrane component KefB